MRGFQSSISSWPMAGPRSRLAGFKRPARRRRNAAAGVSVSVMAQSYQPARLPTSQSHCDVAPAATRRVCARCP